MSEFPETRDSNEKRNRIGPAYHCPDTDQYIIMVDDDPRIEIARLQTALTDAINTDIEKTRELLETRATLQAANEDAERQADECAFYEEGIGLRCIHCGGTARDGYALSHAADCPITLHRARVGGAS